MKSMAKIMERQTATNSDVDPGQTAPMSSIISFHKSRKMSQNFNADIIGVLL